MKQDITLKIEIPEGVNAELNKDLLKISGPQGEVIRNFKDMKISIKKENSCIILDVKKATKKEKARIYTYEKHIKNMIKGVVEGHEYEVKICSGHFPMNVSFSNNKLVVKNFLGEKYPRELNIDPRVDVKVEGDYIKISSPDIELAGQTAANMELLTRITNRDRRIFQDGLYITKKPTKEL